MREPYATCETCTNFDSSGHSAAVETGGFCRAHPPVADDRNGLARWPTVDWLDWCAEHRRAPEILPPPAPVETSQIFDDIPF